MLARWEREGTFERLREQNRRRPDLLVHGRPDHGQQPGGVHHGHGPHAEGRLPALQGPPRVRSALPERLRLPGPLGRGRGREVARPPRQARDRGVRPGGIRGEVPRARCVLQRGDDRAVPPSRPVDGLGQRLLHVQRHEHRVHLGLSQERCTSAAGCTRVTARPVVPALRHVALAARAGGRGELHRDGAPVALRALPAGRPPG